MDCSTPGLLSITSSWSLLKLMSIELVMPSNHLIFCHLLLLPPWIFPSIRVFYNESVLHIRWPKCWSFSFSISPSNEYSELISFRMDWLGLLAVQGTPKNLLQHHSAKASILQCSTFFIVQLSHPYMTAGKTTALTRPTFVDKVTSLLFNMLSKLVIAFLPRSKRLLVSWPQSPSAVILEPWYCGVLVFWKNWISHRQYWKPDEFSKSLDLWGWRNWKAWQQEALIPTWSQLGWGERSQPASPAYPPVSQLSYLPRIYTQSPTSEFVHLWPDHPFLGWGLSC